MSTHVCPWWLGPLLASPVRKLVQDPARILAPHVREGMTVLEPGPGMGFFTIELARRVGPRGRVIAVELQPRMLAGLRRRAARAGLAARIDARPPAPDGRLGVADLAGRGGRVLVAEPSGHVKAAAFEAMLAAAAGAGLRPDAGPRIARSHTAVLAAA